jgi:hypothetical protein
MARASALGQLPPGNARQRQVCAHLLSCRTAALGGFNLQCDRCGLVTAHYYACRDRHCPRCQGRACRRWSERQQADVLPVNYFHLVFTLPHVLNPWVALHPERLYSLLFESVWSTLKAFGADPKRLGGELGMTAVLHTWGENLTRHVHLHCLVPGGALRADGRWRSVKGCYLFPVRALTRRFRGHLVGALRTAAQSGQLERINPGEVDAILDTLMAQDWVVYAKHCLHHTDSVVEYLARYSHRIALSNQRIVDLDDDMVRLSYRDYRDHARRKVMSLAIGEFLRRFLLHVLPKGFMRIRHYGFLANRTRREKLSQIRAALAQPEPETPDAPASLEPTHFDGLPCPQCRVGRLAIVGLLPPQRLDAG